MKYEIQRQDKVIGITELEGGDPPMGFVFGAVDPTDFYLSGEGKTDYKIYTCDTNEEIASESITIEDLSEAMGEQCIEVTVLVKSAEEYERFFKHHLDAYGKQFS
ncbi:hypothetical protein [Shewanella loihica]|uniref:Uncharacterized protein n=1 Tax=Shewanella loihica (strain ATCC BAA-1088 / PV-4) TaxID=323850 RepID=A3QAH4_SHELP|nr:hypothetical protein [Shewanella loihica]ABO22472.1 hypothetical protein Shew_0600 [Shewanella loihica PV-4]